jgi:hypothetical protein
MHGPNVLYPELPQRHLANRQIHTLPFHPAAKRTTRYFILSPQGF